MDEDPSCHQYFLSHCKEQDGKGLAAEWLSSQCRHTQMAQGKDSTELQSDQIRTTVNHTKLDSRFAIIYQLNICFYVYWM